ncbi:MAG: DNA-binding protein [Candidatus Nitrosopelagicus sp.]|nr:DNA-binding protein [Candidatus Nitrosopelagicus sp.]
MSEDNELEKLKAKRLAEMQKNLSSKQKPKKDKPTPREIVITKLGFRGLEVLENAEYQFPRETQMVVLKLAELISSNQISEILDGGHLLSLFRSIGIGVRMKTKINIEEDGKFISISDKLGKKLSSN